MAMLFDSVCRAIDPRTAPEGPYVVQWEFPDAEPWHLRVDNGNTATAPGRAPDVDLELRVGARLLMDEVSFRVDRGDKIGLVGRNGAGKTTLTKVLAGELPQSGGTIERGGQIEGPHAAAPE